MEDTDITTPSPLHQPTPPFPETVQSLGALNVFTQKLATLERCECISARDPEFITIVMELYSLFDRYQHLLMPGSDYSVTCTTRCHVCCNHWVDDVHSFEAEIIADYVKRNLPEKIVTIYHACYEDWRELQRLEQFVTEKLASLDHDSPDNPSLLDLLFSAFYTMERPCPLLDDQGRCAVYPVRPLTCRMYVSIANPMWCNPEHLYNKVPTCITGIPEATNHILDRLHERYIQNTDSTGLRALLVYYLEN